MKLGIDPDGTVQILHLTDTHLSTNVPAENPPKSFSDAAAALNGMTTDESLSRVLEHVADFKADLVLHTGDLVEVPGPEAYRLALDQMKRIERPLLICPGNHDDASLLTEMSKGRGLPQRCIDAGRWRILVVDSTGDGHGGFVGEAELSALYQHATKWDGPVLVGLHHPPLSTCSHPDCKLSDAEAFLDVIDRVGNVMAVASGHLHNASEAERSGVKYLLGPATCLQLNHQHPLPEHNRSSTRGGARYIHLLPSGEVQSSLHWA